MWLHGVSWMVGGGTWRTRHQIVGTLLATFFLTFPASAEIITIKQAVDGFIRPAYATLAQKADGERQAVAELCATPSQAALDNARAAFVDVVKAWSAVETIRIGPITEQNRLERFLYWPDRKGIGLRQVQTAIAAEDGSASDAKSLAGKSVAMQGLGALEFVLFGTGSEDLLSNSKPYRCAFGSAIVQNLTTIAVDVSTEWAKPDGFADQWINPGPEDPLYRSEKEAATDFIDTFVQGLELVRDVRVNGFLGDDAGGDKPRQAIFWRSNATVPALAANLEGLKRHFDASGLAGRLKDDNAFMGGSIDFEFSNAAKALAGLDAPIADLLKDDTARQKLAYFRLVTSSLSDLFGTQLSGALGLTAGFSSLDGD
jgi:predicted lipoprotein